MSAKSYSFTVGRFNCAALLDGAVTLGEAGMLRRFPQGSEAEYRRAYADIGLSLDESENSYNILVAAIGDDVVLVDTGQGSRPGGGLLPESLRLAGVAPDAVTLVVITHTHGDHVLGLLADDGEPAFPNARYVLSCVEMAYWQGRIADDSHQQAIVAMMQARGLRLIEMDELILPGLTAVPIPGHTPGQIALLFESDGDKLIHMADVLHSPMQFAHPEWSPSFDADAAVSVPPAVKRWGAQRMSRCWQCSTICRFRGWAGSSAPRMASRGSR